MDKRLKVLMVNGSPRENGNMLTDQHRKDIEEYIKETTNPFDISVEFKLLATKCNCTGCCNMEKAGIPTLKSLSRWRKTYTAI